MFGLTWFVLLYFKTLACARVGSARWVLHHFLLWMLVQHIFFCSLPHCRVVLVVDNYLESETLEFSSSGAYAKYFVGILHQFSLYDHWPSKPGEFDVDAISFEF